MVIFHSYVSLPEGSWFQDPLEWESSTTNRRIARMDPSPRECLVLACFGKALWQYQSNLANDLQTMPTEKCLWITMPIIKYRVSFSRVFLVATVKSHIQCITIIYPVSSVSSIT